MTKLDRVRSECGWCYFEDSRKYVNRMTGEVISYMQLYEDSRAQDLMNVEPSIIHRSIESAMKRGPNGE